MFERLRTERETAMVNVKLMLGVFAIGAAFAAGWKTNGWRLESRYQAEEIARQQSITQAMIAQRAYVDQINAESQEREAGLLAARERDEGFIRELQNEIDERPVIRETVRVPIVTESGAIECPSVATVDWGVFQTLYNSAATGPAETGTAGSSNAALSQFAANDPRGPRSYLGAVAGASATDHPSERGRAGADLP